MQNSNQIMGCVSTPIQPFGVGSVMALDGWQLQNVQDLAGVELAAGAKVLCAENKGKWYTSEWFIVAAECP